MHTFHIYQAIITAVSAFMIFQGIKNYISGKSSQTIYKLAIRIIVWGGMAIVALFPFLTNTLAKIIGLEGNINAVILVGFILIFLMIFKLLSAIERLEQNISILTRKDALKEIKKPE
jgi:hypothetical protein